MEGRLQGAESLHICETANRGGFTERLHRETESGRESLMRRENGTGKESETPLKRAETPPKRHPTPSKRPETTPKRPETPPQRPTTPPQMPTTPVQKPETPSQRPETAPINTPTLIKGPDSPPKPLPSVLSPTSSYSPDLPLKPASLNDRIVRLEHLQVLPRPRTVLSSDRPLSLSDLDAAKDLQTYLPGEAASVLVNSLLEKSRPVGSQESFQVGDLPISRSISPISGSFLWQAGNEEKAQGPSRELQEYLRGKGFQFPGKEGN